MKEADNKLITKKMIERLIIIHNAIKSGMYPNNKQLQKLYCEQTGYAKVGEATISRDIDTLRTYFRAHLNTTARATAFTTLTTNGNSLSTKFPWTTPFIFLPQKPCWQISKERQCMTKSPK